MFGLFLWLSVLVAVELRDVGWLASHFDQVLELFDSVVKESVGRGYATDSEKEAE